jgi:hypothetical protein
VESDHQATFGQRINRPAFFHVGVHCGLDSPLRPG